MNENISLQEIVLIIKKRLWLIVGIVFMAVFTSVIISYFFLTPVYQASTQILVTQQESAKDFDSTDIQTNLQLINTYNVIIKSPVILSHVIEILDLDTTPALLDTQLTISSEQNSQVVNLTVQDVDHYKAVDIVNTTAAVFQKEIVNLMKVDNVSILSEAIQSDSPVPVTPNKTLNIAVATIIGMIIGVALAFLLEYLDTTVKTEKDIEELLSLPILGIISPISDKAVAARTKKKKLRVIAGNIPSK